MRLTLLALGTLFSSLAYAGMDPICVTNDTREEHAVGVFFDGQSVLKVDVGSGANNCAFVSDTKTYYVLRSLDNDLDCQTIVQGNQTVVLTEDMQGNTACSNQADAYYKTQALGDASRPVVTINGSTSSTVYVANNSFEVLTIQDGDESVCAGLIESPFSAKPSLSGIADILWVAGGSCAVKSSVLSLKILGDAGNFAVLNVNKRLGGAVSDCSIRGTYGLYAQCFPRGSSVSITVGPGN